ncbi:MAG: nucleotidyltransferase domain-containing protein [Muribaculaceae bacterium]|nr:nucleotidyltransferase domain-containing protein [Muribaculaceae bacterium]
MSGKYRFIELLTEASPYIRKEFGVRSMSMFGSVARGEERADSDVDIFVDMPPKALNIIGLKQYLQGLLGTAVDVVRNHAHLDPFLVSEISRDGITIFSE